MPACYDYLNFGTPSDNMPLMILRGARVNVAKSKSSMASATTKEDNVVVRYFKETRAELRKVTWPTREEAKNLTLIIVTVTVVMAIFLGALDYVFQVVTAGIIGGDFIRITIAVVLLIGGVAAFYFNNQQE